MAGKRRIWSDDEKRSICLQAQAPGVSVARVARRYSMNANLVFKWLRDPRFAPEAVAHDAVFLPVEISPDVAIGRQSVSGADGRVVIELSGGHRVVAESGYDAEALGRLLKVWRP